MTSVRNAQRRLLAVAETYDLGERWGEYPQRTMRNVVPRVVAAGVWRLAEREWPKARDGLPHAAWLVDFWLRALAKAPENATSMFASAESGDAEDWREWTEDEIAADLRSRYWATMHAEGYSGLAA